MKGVSGRVLMNVGVLLILGALSAGMLMATMTGDKLWVPRAAAPPVIDGEMDGIWKSVTANPMTKRVGATDASFWLDLNGMFRLMYDADYLYVFVHIMDEDLKTGVTSGPWEADGVELYFDGNNSRTAGAFDGVDDIGIRLNYDAQSSADLAAILGESGTDWGFPLDAVQFAIVSREPTWEDGGDWAFYGWNLEVAIPLANLNIGSEPGTVFGFEIQINDNDNDATRDEIAKWWNDSDDTWKNASLFGSCMLSGYQADEVMNILMLPDNAEMPVIDAEMEQVWVITPEISDNTPVLWENNPAGTSWSFHPEYMESWDDHMFNVRFLWDPEYLYFFYRCFDDELLPGQSTVNSYVSESFGFYFDPNNSKGVAEASYSDDNTSHHWGLAPELVDGEVNDKGNDILWAYRATDRGYDVEGMIPLSAGGEVVKMDPEAGHEFGFDIIAGDRDSDNDADGFQVMKKWWNADNYTWADVSTLGTARLSGDTPSMTGVIPEAAVSPGGFDLAQNYPNPFNAHTVLAYTLGQAGPVHLSVYDLLGRCVAVLVDDVQAAGEHRVTFDASELTSGLYLSRLEAGPRVVTRKMTYLR